ncbi:MAG TPA: hypothetical protein VGW10_06255 [Solirubrobacteraceae bacterium]|nr:hypothetical protein [Solirubrobacteraceae bacterium]
MPDQYEALLTRVCDLQRHGALPPELIDAPAPPQRDSSAAPTAA